MKYIKTYEQNNVKPNIGDYVIIDIDWRNFRFEKHIKDRIGVITDYKSDTGIYIIQFPDLEWYFYIENIKHFSNDKSDLEAIITSKKYNL